MKKTAISLFLILFCMIVSGQSQADSVIVIRKPLGTVFQQNGKYLTPKQLVEITSINPDAVAEMKKAKTNYSASMVFSYIGGFMIGWPIGTAIAGGDPEWALAGIGAGLIGISIPFSASYTRHARNGVAIYNRTLNYSGSVHPEYRLKLMANGIGLQISFGSGKSYNPNGRN
jgi:hypothetical protein